jgi:hypothetical protein
LRELPCIFGSSPLTFESPIIRASTVSGKKSEVFGLVGTITYDCISFSSGRSFSGLGGILYQAAALCGLGKEVHVFSNLGEELLPVVKKVTSNWPRCEIRGLCVVPGPGNRVHLRYPARGERVEVLESHVPPLNPQALIGGASRFDLLIAVINSGRDFTFREWREIVGEVKPPIWLDIHSLALSFVLHRPRSYRRLAKWQDWVGGLAYVQANEREVASMLGEPGAWPTLARIKRFGREALELGLRAIFITLGKKGVLVMTRDASRVLEPPAVRGIVDTTGCGDVFCAATAASLVAGADPVDAASLGVKLASRAARAAGVEETYALVRSFSL